MRTRDTTRPHGAQLTLAGAGNFNDGLPAAWAGSFDAVFSAEVLCHAADKPALLTAVAACLRPGGALVFSDIMGADGADEAALRAFTERNATTSLGRPSEYAAAIVKAGLRQLAWWDNSHHLERYFRAMLAQIDAHEGFFRSGLDRFVWIYGMVRSRAHSIASLSHS